MSASKQVRITKVVVTLGDAPKAPVFSIPEGVYFEPQSVALTAEEGTFIIYTLNGEDPDYTDDSNYTGIKYDGTPLTISETTTIAAIAVDAKGTTSNIVSATYTVVTIQEGSPSMHQRIRVRILPVILVRTRLPRRVFLLLSATVV